MPRRFPPPWIAEETDACFIVKDHAGQSLAYVTPQIRPPAAGRRRTCSAAMCESMDTLRGYVRDADIFKRHAGQGLL
jgi:hypothetical protein